MKKKHFAVLMPLLIISLFLSACGSAVPAGAWPGITYDESRGLVYLAYNQSVLALRVEDGVTQWKYPAEAQPAFQVFSAPQLAADQQLIIGTYGNQLYKLNPDNSGNPAPNWPFNGASNRYIGSALVVGDSIFAANADGHLYALNLDGQLDWPDQDNRGPLWTQPVSDGEILYIPSMDHRIYAIEMASGDPVPGWENGLDLGSAIVGQPALSEDGLLFVSTLDKSIVTVDTRNGDLLDPNFVTQGSLWSGPALIDGQLYIGDLDGMFYAFDVRGNGESDCTLDLGSAVTGTPTLFDELLYVATEAGQLFSISLDGSISEIPLLEAYQAAKYGSPVVAGDLLLIGMVNSDVILIAVDASGKVAWQYSQAQ
jgi:outer membrane protein assembly factor BamB